MRSCGAGYEGRGRASGAHSDPSHLGVVEGEPTCGAGALCERVAAALDSLGHRVLLGVIYPFLPFPVRRVFLPRSKYHVDYSVEGELLKVRAVWHAARGAVPVLM